MIPAIRKSKVQSSLKKSLRKAKIKRSVDSLAWLNYILFMKTLAAESQAQARAEKSKTVTAEHVKAVKKMVIRKMRG